MKSTIFILLFFVCSCRHNDKSVVGFEICDTCHVNPIEKLTQFTQDIYDSAGNKVCEVKADGKIIVYDSLLAIKALLWIENYHQNHPTILILENIHDTTRHYGGDTIRGNSGNKADYKFAKLSL